MLFALHKLDTVIRTDNPGLKHIFLNTRSRVLNEPALSIAQLITELEAHCTANIPLNLSENGLAGRDDALVLYRRRGDVLRSGAFLADSQTTAFRVRMSGLPRCLAPWLAGVFWDWDSKSMSEAELRARLRDRELGEVDGCDGGPAPEEHLLRTKARL